MIGFRLVLVVPFLMLASCAHKTQNLNALQNLENTESPAQIESTDNTNSAPIANEPTNLKQDSQLNVDTITTKDGKKLAKTDSKALNNGTMILDKKQANGENSAASKISSFELSGAMAVRSKGKGWTASVNWIQRGAGSYQIRLSGPIGSGTMLISKNGGVVTFRDGSKTASSSNADSLLRQQTGISLPVSSLYYWVRGIPAPGAAHGKQYDQGGHLLALRQQGYLIDYQGYRSAGRAALPSSIRLQGNGVFIKLVIKNWRA